MKAALLVCLSLTVLSHAQRVERAVPEPPPQVKELIAQLPECSRVRQELAQGRYGDGIEKPYMRSMLDHGVRRAYFEFEGKWRHNHVEKIRIVRRLYFSQFDGPNTMITDAGQLKEIESSGLQAVLDQSALTKAANAGPFRLIDINILEVPLLLVSEMGWYITGSKVSGSVEFFASGWLYTPPRIMVIHGRHPDSLAYAVYLGDVNDLAKFLHQRKYSQAELNRALAFALNTRRDETATISLLIQAGADVNARFGEEMTPLMLATELCPCNIPVLLAHGAHVEDHDESGRTASDLARQHHNTLVLRLLQNSPQH